MKTNTTQTSDWREDFDRKFPNFKSRTEPRLEYFHTEINATQIKMFIQSLLDQQEQRHQREIGEAEKRGALTAYKMFLNTIKEAKNKFPGRKEFELVVDVRDIEKSIDQISQSIKENEI